MDATRDSPASLGMHVISYTLVCVGPNVRSASPVKAINPLVGDCKADGSSAVLGSRSNGDNIVQGVVVSASTLRSDWSRIGRRQPSNTTFTSENVRGLDEGWAQDAMISWPFEGSPTFPSEL